MRIHGFLRIAIGTAVVAGLALIAFVTRDHWLSAPGGDEHGEDVSVSPAQEPKMLKLTAQARKNLALASKPVQLQEYWRSIQVPGVIVDRPGHSDRGVPAPVASVVVKVHAFPGDTVRQGDVLFTLRPISESLHTSQAELFKSVREAQLVKEQKDRLASAALSGAVPETKIVELDNQLRRLTVAVQAHRQDLLTRGLTLAQIEAVAEGKFVSEIAVTAPAPLADGMKPVAIQSVSLPSADRSNAAPDYEVHELKVELGQQVQAGQILGMLANHQSLFIEGHSFRREAPFLEKAAQKGWPIRVEFAEGGDTTWPPLGQDFRIRHLSNTVDSSSRTFDFFIPLTNQSRSYVKDGKTFLVWRFRPGQRVRLHVPVEQFKDVVVLPAGAVVREGPDAYAFRQNGDLFERRAVHVLYEDRLHVVLANDGSVRPEIDYLAQGAAASLNRVLKAQNVAGALPPGAHFHADGSLHIPGK